jgi:hypothetical protein
LTDRVLLCPAHFAQKVAGTLMRGVLYDIIARPKEEGEDCRACEAEKFND